MNLKMPDWGNVRITARHWHYAAVGLLCAVNLVLAVRLIYAWQRAEAGNAARLQQHEAEYRAMQLKTRPLRGLDKKIAQAQLDQQSFYEKRFPSTYSAVLTELGALAVKNNVLLASGQYAQGKLNEDAYQIRMNINLTGDYAPTVRFINDLERDRIFFIIDGIALSGQQNGVVSLRMGLTTYLRAPAENAAPANASPMSKAPPAAHSTAVRSTTAHSTRGRH